MQSFFGGLLQQRNVNFNPFALSLSKGKVTLRLLEDISHPLVGGGQCSGFR